ncbi:RCC1 repeat domain protein, 2 domains [Bifidobacterium polysaccharolyticum]|uniref:RCC1 domain-containing protein n=1 Tax=Bifidobacterium polysaccharolyticum TaxID=2750967 RepID=UPI00061E170B|nr:RCC1 repeat domain protein, 2 domains [Bifidobacterium asteroides]
MVRFDPADGGKPTQESVKTGILASPPERNPQRNGFRFDGWTLDGQPYDLQTPILQDTTLKARWSKTTDWTLSPDHGPASGTRLTISPPDKQEPRFSNIHAAGEQTVGLTGDGSIYAWTRESAPKQVPSPARAPQGFHYLQAAAGSGLQAALGSDQRIYTWNSQQATPTILNTDRNTGFTSISMNDDRLLAVDRQGYVHAYQAGSQDQTPEFTQQVRAGLPGQAHAVLAAASDKRILIVDADGQAWTWETSKIGKAEPSRIEQEQGMRIIQAQALSEGFLLVYGDGQTQYLNESTTSSATNSLPESMKAGRIAGDKDQAIITGTDGQVWAWKPGKAPKRADDGSQQYTQAAEADGRIIATSTKGAMFTWSLDAQGNPGKPSRLKTTSTPILESASLDGQPLKLNKTGDTWQADIPAREPGPAAITLAGRQDGQPFTKSLNYTVDEPLTRDATTDSTHTVTFDTGEAGTKPEDQNVSTPYGRAKRPSPDPVRDGYQFDGWFIGQVAYDFSKPVTQNLTLTAKWTLKDPNNTWKINPDKGSQTGGQQTTITPPAAANSTKFNQVSSSGTNNFSLAVGSDGNAYAWGFNNYGQLGNGNTSNRNTPVIVKKPAGVSADFTYVQVSAGTDHSLAVGSDGYAYAWGNNNNGQLGNNTTSFSSVPVRVCDPSTGSNVDTGLKAIQVSAGRLFSLAIDQDGNTWAWGNNDNGQLGNGNTRGTNTPQSVLLDPKHASTVLKTVQVSAGDFHSLAIDQDGNTWAWGRNDYGQLGNGKTSGTNANPTPSSVLLDPKHASTVLKAVQVSAGGSLSLVIDQDGNTWAWGHNDYGQLGNGSTSSLRNPVPSSVLLNPKDTSTVLKAVQVSAGWAHSMAIDTDGNAWAWGQNNYGKLGNNTTSDQHSPVKVFASAKSTSAAGSWLSTAQISAGGNHSLAIGKDGNTSAWGFNRYGQLGNGTTSGNDANRVPVPVTFDLSPVITGVSFDGMAIKNISKSQDDGSVTVTTPPHEPGEVTVSVGYTLGGTGSTLTYDSLRYTYTPLGVLPKAGGEGVLLVLATGMTSMGGVLASRRHLREQRQLLHTLHE